MDARLRGWVGVLAILLAVCGCASWTAEPPAPGSPTRAELEQLLATVRVVPHRPHPGGYERGCAQGQACVFGPSWSDDHPGPGGNDGCDTRNNVLAGQLGEVIHRPGTRGCVVLSGTFADPYTGARIVFDKSDAARVPIDHVYPLAAAWDLGASSWASERRTQFANDIDYNLLATDREANRNKSDSTPAEWLPPSLSGHCFYAGKYLTVALRYDLPITVGDQRQLHRVAATCP